ncbi:Antitoxin HipB [Variovorax sp. RA8]|nr:helix-turn-helix domain-containing protein [Variovorax sp. RA8]VTU32074.1 Antitoxin HipB [Variovorax sp. RA8]
MRQKLSLPSQLGPILRGARKAESLSQADLAARVGLSQKRVSSLELNPSAMTIDQLLTITAVLGVEVMLQPYGTDVPKVEW